MNKTMYSIRYRYENPSNAGPFQGKTVTPDKYAKGDTIHAVFGRAIVTSCQKIKVSA